MQMPGLVRAADLEALRHRIGEATRERMLRELAEALELLTAQQPLVLVLEDLHWSDPSTLDLIAVLARRREPARLLLIGTYRPPEVLRRTHPLHTIKQELQLHEHCVELLLTSLLEDAVATYLARRLPGLPQVNRLTRLVHRRTEGNPLFMVALVDSWLTQGALLDQDGAWALAAEVEALHDGVPNSLQQMIDMQLDGLSAEEQRVLEAASVAGMEFSAAAVAAGLAQEAEYVDDWCTSLARRGQFLRASGEQTWPDGTVAGCYSFVHALYQQVLYHRVSAAQRVRLHQRIGARLEAGHGAQASAIAVELAMHFERGRDAQRTVQYLQQAGQRSMERSAYVEAVSHLTRGLEVLQTLPDTPECSQQELMLHIALGASLIATKGYAAPEVELIYARARQLCHHLDDSQQRFSALHGLRSYYQTRAEYQTARTLAEQLLILAQHTQDSAMLVAACRATGTTLLMEARALALSHLIQGMALYDPQQHHTTAFRYGEDNGVACFSRAAWTLWWLGYPDQGLVRSDEAVTLAQQSAHPLSLCFALTGAAVFHQCCRQERAVQEHAEAAISLATEYGIPLYRAFGAIMQGWALAHQGQTQEGLAQIQQGLTAWRDTGAETLRPYFLALLAEAYGAMGQPETGMIALTEALVLVEKTGERWYEPESYRLKGALLLQRSTDHHAEAQVCFQQAIAVADGQQAKSWELRAAMSLSRLWQRQGQCAAARELLAPIYGWFTEGFDTADLQEAKVLLTELA
jgi:predicted ATPase